MKGEVSVPYFCAWRMHEIGRRRTFDVAVQFRFQNHAFSVVPSRARSAAVQSRLNTRLRQ